MLFFRLFMLLVAVALVATGLLMIESAKEEMMSFLVAYSSSAIVLLASFRNYNSMVKRGVAAKSFVVDNCDTVERIDDPFDLYSEENREYDSEASLKEIIKAQKRALKKGKASLKERAINSLNAFRPLRLLSYLILVLGFFYLLKQKSLVLSYYLSALIIPILIVIFYLFIVGVHIEVEEEN